MRKEVFLDKLKIKRPVQFGFYNYDLVTMELTTHGCNATILLHSFVGVK